ncbi:MAG: DUF2189 domain-containing protein [Pseudohongiellaceae bacterium]
MSAQTDVSTDLSDSITSDRPVVRRITVRDLGTALYRGRQDFYARPTHGVFLTVIYALVAAVVVFIGLRENLLVLLFPVIAGLALIGPVAACGLYELSRRRENGQNYAWWHVFDVFNAPSRGAIAVIAVMLAILFAVWLMTAVALYGVFFGDTTPASFAGLLSQVFSTPSGWQLLLTGGAIGFVYSVVVFVTTVVSLPMMMHHRIGLLEAVGTSLRAVQLNWRPMAVWYLMVVGLVILGAVPLFIGLAVVVPMLGHATWHLYRAAVE